MNEIKNQKGFIQIPLLAIIIAILGVGVAAGVVLQQKKLSARIIDDVATANIAGALENTEKNIETKPEFEIQDEPESSLETEQLQIEKKQIPAQEQNQKEQISPQFLQNQQNKSLELEKEESVCKPSQEICDGIDNDCDGKIDENLTQQCGILNVGVCKFGVQTCQNGKWGKCIGAINPTIEICDQKDNDCDERIDENLTKQCGTSNVGVCEFGTKTCQNGKWGKCIGTVNPTNEICDGKDNDCDGLTDENLTKQCGTFNIGICRFGTKICQNSKWGECVGIVKPTTEICDQKDNDCDGQIDEGSVCAVLEPEPKAETKTHRDRMIEIFKENASDEWGSDYVMVNYEVKNQTEAYDWVVKQTKYSTIMNRAKSEWGNDYKMVKYEYEGQAEDYEWINQQTAYPDIMDRSKAEWSNDYRMVKYEYEKQTEAYKWINQQTVYPEIMARAKQKWGNDYAMVKYEYEKQVEAYGAL